MDDVQLPLQLPMDNLPLRLRFDRPMTDDELQTFCERQEVLHVEREPDGVLTIRPIWGTRTGMISCHIMVDLAKWAESTGSGYVLPTVGFFLPDGSMRGPKLAFVTSKQFNPFKQHNDDGFLVGAPPFLVEVVSINYTLEELRTRMQMFLDNGSELAWLIDPSRKVVEIYRPGREPEVLEGGSAVEGEGPVAGFVLELGRIWG